MTRQELRQLCEVMAFLVASATGKACTSDDITKLAALAEEFALREPKEA